MRILVNDIAASEGGALSILQDFYLYIKDNDKKNEWIFLLSDFYLKDNENIKVKVLRKPKKNWINRIKFDFFEWKNIVEADHPDVIFSLQNTVYLFCPYPQVVYIHQPLPFQKEKNFSILKREERKYWVYQQLIGRLIKYSARKAKGIIVQTEWMKKAIEKEVKQKKVYKVPPKIETNVVKKNKSRVVKGFVYPTSDIIYKNNECLYKACAILYDKNYKCTVEVTLNKSTKKKNVKFIGKIPREELLNKYNEYALVFPSYIETFGLPLAEARNYGTIILAADTTFAHEILEGYENVYYFDPFRPEQLAVLMKKVLTGEIQKKETTQICEDVNAWRKVVDLIEECGE